MCYIHFCGTITIWIRKLVRFTSYKKNSLSILLGSMEEGEYLFSLDCEWHEEDVFLRTS